MALVGPVLVHDTTNTSGTGSLSLNNATSDGRRGLADAVTNGDAANGDTCYYVVEQSTTSGSSLVFEAGLGTISDSGATLSRDTPYQSSNGGAKVSLPGGATYDVQIVVLTENILQSANNLSDIANAVTAAANLGVPRLAGSNVHTGSNVFDGAASTGSVDLSSNLSTGSVGKIRGVGQNSLATDKVYGEYKINADDGTAGSEDGSAVFSLMLAGVLTNAWQFKGDGTLTYLPSGKKYDAFPSGTRLLIGNAATPPGWTIVASLADRMIMLTSTESEIDDTGGSWTTGITASTTVNGHTLTAAEIPAHSHNIQLTAASGGGPGLVIDGGIGDGGVYATGSAGSGGSHSHTASTSISSTSYRPAYYKAAFYQKS